MSGALDGQLQQAFSAMQNDMSGMQDTIQALFAHVSDLEKEVELYSLVLNGVAKVTDKSQHKLRKLKHKV